MTFSPERNTRVAFSCACVLTTSAHAVAAARIVRLNICNLLKRLHKTLLFALCSTLESAEDEPDQRVHHEMNANGGPCRNCQIY